MAIPSVIQIEVQTGGSDTLNGGIFVPGSTGKPTDLAATSGNTSAPVVTSASYNFVAGDVGNFLYVQAGSNWTPGWYPISSVSANAATLNAAIGAAVLATGVMNTVAGCATTTSPTAGTWAVDYSQVAVVPFSLTGLTTAAANAIILTASATKAMVGNGIVITGGTNFTAGIYVVTACTAGVSLTVDRTCTTAAGTAGTAGLGGAWASLGFSITIASSGAIVFQKAGTYSISTASVNVAGGTLSSAGGAVFCGYNTNRNLYNTDTKPINQYNASTVTFTNTRGMFINIELDGHAQTAAKVGTNADGFVRCMFRNMSASSGGSALYLECQATTCSTSVFVGVAMLACEAYANTATPFASCGFTQNCLSYGNTGATTDGFSVSAINGAAANCIAYNNGRDGFLLNGGGRPGAIINCHAENNAQYGFNVTSSNAQILHNCSHYNNTSGGVNATGIVYNLGTLAVTAGSVFTNAAGNDFSLNSTANQGALLRAAGFPGVFPRGTTTGYLDIGAVQSRGGGMIQQQQMLGGMT